MPTVSLEMFSSEAALETMLLRYSSLVPRNANPYTLLRRELASAFSWKAPRSFGPLLIAASALLAICSAIFIVGFLIRARRGTLWAFRVVRVGREKYLLGSLVLMKGGFDALTSITLQVFVWLANRANAKVVQHRILALILPWLPGGVAASFALWCLSLTFILHLRTYSSETAKVPWYLSSLLVNFVGIALPFVLLGSILPLTLVASKNYDDGMVGYVASDEVLNRAQESWRKGDSADPEVLDRTARILFTAIARFEDAALWFQYTYWCLTAWCTSFTLSFILIGWLYVRALQRTINELGSSKSCGSESIGYRAFTKTRRWLLNISSVFVISMAAVSAHSAWIGYYCKEMLRDGRLYELAVVLPVFTIAILGLPVSILLLLHACHTPLSPSSVAGGSSKSSPVSTLHLSKSLSTSDLSRHYTELQYNLAAQLPLPDRPFFGSVTDGRGVDDNDAAPFDDLELTSRDSTVAGKEGILIERKKEVTVVTLPKIPSRESVEDEEQDKW